MKPSHQRLIQEQLDMTLERLACMRDAQHPAKGWLRAVREALGMPGKQFARRLGVESGMPLLPDEKELTGSVTIKTMRQAAEALDCVFVYAVVPGKRLYTLCPTSLSMYPILRIGRVSHSMLLEAQQLSQTELRNAFEAKVETLIREMPKELWDDPNEL